MAEIPLNYDFGINGLALDSNTLRIEVNKQNINQYHSIMRQEQPIGIRSGKATMSITVELAFPNAQETDVTLRHLIAHLKISPFVQIESTYIANSIVPDDFDTNVMAATLSNFSLSTRQGEPESLYVSLALVWFNYLPYSADFSFKTRTKNNTLASTDKIYKSTEYNKKFASVLDSVPKFSLLGKSTVVRYNTFEEIPIVFSEKFTIASLREIGKTLHYVDAKAIDFQGGSNKMDGDAAAALKIIAKRFKSKHGKKVPVTNTFLPAFHPDMFLNESGATHKDHEAGIAFDVLLFDNINKIKAYDAYSDAYKKQISFTDEDYKKFIVIARDHFTDNGQGHFRYTRKTHDTDNLSRKYHEYGAAKIRPGDDGYVTPIIKELGKVAQDTSRLYSNVYDNKQSIKDFSDTYSQVIIEAKSKGLLQTNKITVWKQLNALEISEGNDELVVAAINASISHVITTLPITGFEYPTHQYLGNRHARAVFSLEGLKGDAINSIKRILNETNRNASGKYRNVDKHNVIRIYNPVTSLLGIDNIIIDQHESMTVPGHPELEVFNFQVTRYDPKYVEDIELSGLYNVDQMKEKILNIFLDGMEVDSKTHLIRMKLSISATLRRDPLKNYYENMIDAINDFIGHKKVNKNYKVTGIYGLEGIVTTALNGKGFRTISKQRKTGGLVTGVASLDFTLDESVDNDLNIKLLSDLRDSLSFYVWDVISSGSISHRFFNKIIDEIENMRKVESVCYPDLDLPKHPDTGSVMDTEPDFFFWNIDEDGKDSLNNRMDEEFNKHYSTIQGHLKGYEVLHESTDIEAHTGKQTVPMETRPRKAYQTDDLIPLQEELKKSQVFASADFEEIMKRSIEDSKNKTYSMRRAFPTFKVYFIEEDVGEELHLIPRLSFDDYFGYNAVSEIRIVKSRKVPADLCIINMSNLSGKLTDATYFGHDDPDKIKEDKSMAAQETHTENPLDALILRPGQRLQVRMGYSNNPDNLDIVFNGQIVEVGGSDMVTIVCQSFATELVSHIKGLEEPEGVNTWFKSVDNKLTHNLLANLMASDEVIHFGTKKANPIKAAILGDNVDPEAEGNSIYGPNTNPQDDNIFAPDWETYVDNVRDIIPEDFSFSGFFSGRATPFRKFPDLDYKLYNTTIWDVFKEMELRHPGWIASPVIYGGRMTMFFGLPTLGYWWRPKTWEEYVQGSHVRKERKSKSTIWSRFSSNFFTKEYSENITGYKPIQGYSEDNLPTYGSYKPSSIKAPPKKEKPKKVDERFKAFRNYHLLNDKINIVANSIKCTSDNVYNAVKVQYVNSVSDIDEYGNANFRTKDTFDLKADMDIQDENINLLFSQQPNCEGEYYAQRYALGLLCRHLKDIYSGSITILGDPSVKPYDIAFVYDEYNDMFGPVGVEQVVHHFSTETGFITEITPDLCVDPNYYTSMSYSQVIEHMYMPKIIEIAKVTALSIGGGAIYANRKNISKAAGAVKSKVAQAGRTVGGHVAEAGRLSNKFLKHSKTAGVKDASKLAFNAIKDRAGDPKQLLGHLKKISSRLSARTAATSALRLAGTAIVAAPGTTVAVAVLAAAGVGIMAHMAFISFTQKKQPIIIHPLMVNKVPFLSGLRGFKQNGIKDSAMRILGEATEGLDQAWKDFKLGWKQIF